MQKRIIEPEIKLPTDKDKKASSRAYTSLYNLVFCVTVLIATYT